MFMTSTSDDHSILNGTVWSRENAMINLRSLFILTDSFLFSFDLRLVLVTRITQISEIAIKFFILWNLCDNTCICVQRKCILLFPTWRWKKRKLNWGSVARNETAFQQTTRFPQRTVNRPHTETVAFKYSQAQRCRHTCASKISRSFSLLSSPFPAVFSTFFANACSVVVLLMAISSYSSLFAVLV